MQWQVASVRFRNRSMWGGLYRPALFMAEMANQIHISCCFTHLFDLHASGCARE